MKTIGVVSRLSAKEQYTVFLVQLMFQEFKLQHNKKLSHNYSQSFRNMFMTFLLFWLLQMIDNYNNYTSVLALRLREQNLHRADNMKIWSL